MMRAPDTAIRKRWMATLAKADPAKLEQLVSQLDIAIGHRFIRSPETGMVMVQARTGGMGRVFNFGEATVTRCSVTTPEGFIGHAYVMGRNRRHAELAALMDARLNDPATFDKVMAGVIDPLETQWNQRKSREAAGIAETKVDFFTLVRGES